MVCETSKILVTGGQGTIGSGVVKRLRSQGHHVVSLGRRHAHDQVAFSLKSDDKTGSYVRCDIGEFRQIERVFRVLGPFDYVFNCAAEFGRWNGEDYYESLWKTNVIGTKHLIRLQEEHQFRLIHFSSSEVYGDWPDVMIETVMDEYEVKQLNDYAMSKWVNEMQIRNSTIHAATKSVIVRLFNTYGPGEHYSPYRSVNCRFLYCALNDLPWTVFRGHSRTSTYLTDTVTTLCNIVGNFHAGETYNIGGDQLHTIEELSDVVLDITAANPSKVQYRESEILTTKAKLVDTTKAIRDLGHQNTVTLEEGMRLTFNWMKTIYSA